MPYSKNGSLRLHTNHSSAISPIPPLLSICSRCLCPFQLLRVLRLRSFPSPFPAWHRLCARGPPPKTDAGCRLLRCVRRCRKLPPGHVGGSGCQRLVGQQKPPLRIIQAAVVARMVAIPPVKADGPYNPDAAEAYIYPQERNARSDA